MGGMRMGGMRMGVMRMEEKFSVRITWGALVSSPLHGCRGCILADGLATQEFALQ
jgi:hypothetical protein